MRAITVEQGGPQPALHWEETAAPAPGPSQVLVAVSAAGVNRADLLQARGHYPPPPGASEILGLEVAGVIESCGSEVTGWKPGDRVCALIPGGGYAEKAVVDHRMLLALPGGWSFAEGAAAPEVWYTAFVNLFLEGNLQPGETALIHAGASGVGTAAIQQARRAGARVFVTAGSEEKCSRCRQLGAELAINHKHQDFLAEIQSATDTEGVDLILDPVGGAYLARNIRALRRFGRLVSIGLLGGATGELPMGLVLTRRLRIIGSTLRSRPLAEQIEITRQFRERIWPHLVSGDFRVVIDRTVPMRDAAEAHRCMLQNENVGKVILTLD